MAQRDQNKQRLQIVHSFYVALSILDRLVQTPGSMTPEALAQALSEDETGIVPRVSRSIRRYLKRFEELGFCFEKSTGVRGIHVPQAFRQQLHVLNFTEAAAYTSRLEKYQNSTGLKDAVITGISQIGEHRAALGVMDFSFLGGSMGSVVGEKLTRLIEKATEKVLPLIIISTSGGARMYEGMFSLMQMAKTCAALAYHGQSRLAYISVLTDPTMAGVMASFASVGDLIIAEPGAMIGFAGPRVIKDTTQAELPPGFQTAEFLLDHGLIDAIVPRKEMKGRLMDYLGYVTTNHQLPVTGR